MISKLLKSKVGKTDNKLRNERVTSPFMGSFLLWANLVFDLWLRVSGNAEGDALNALKNNLADPNNVLQSWDPTQANPCMWFRVTCNSDNRVIRVDLGDENLSGQLVPQLGHLPNLQYMELYSNNIRGKIPDELGNLTNLVSLDLYLNRLTGPIPDTFGNLKKLRFLRLNNNSLSGNIPLSLTTVPSLQVLDISNNQLEGDVPINGSFRSIPNFSFQNNPGLKQQKFSSPSPISPMLPALSGNNTAAVAGGVAAAITALWFAAYAIAFVYWRRRKLQDRYVDVPAVEGDPDKIQHDQLKQFSLFDLQVATDNFSSQNILGRGASGKVYKGRLADGSLVAVKRLKQERTLHLEQQFLAEVKMISMAVHRNLLRLHGFCITPTEWLLVYPFMVNKSLDWCLQDHPESQPPLGWLIRKRIALGVARGLAYLHDHCDLKIIHRDIRAANILLDKEFEAIIGDFGLAKLMDYNHTHFTASVRGTIGHIAPEYLSTGKSSEKTDIYGYGIMLLELITAQRAFVLIRLASQDDDTLPNWVKGILEDGQFEKLVDAHLQGNYNEEEVEQLIQVSLLCTQEDHSRRPKMTEVVSMLEGDDFSEKWEQYFQNEVFQQDLEDTYDDYRCWESHSTSLIPPDELSGPR